MKQKLFAGALIIALLVCCSSCKKKSPEPPPCVAGTGGFIQVVLFANHGNTPMYNYITHPDTVFVKFNTLAFPGTSSTNYDTFVVSDFSMRNHIHVTNLKCGNYYFFRTAFDSIHNLRYYGGIGLTVEPTVHEIDTTLSVN